MFDEKSSQRPAPSSEGAAVQQAYWKCHQLFGAAVQAMDDMQFGLAQGFADKAIREADSMRWPDPELALIRADARLCAAEVASQAGSLNEAIQYLNEAIGIRAGLAGECDGDVYSIRARRGDLYIRQGQLPQALADWQSIIDWAEKDGDKPGVLVDGRLGYSRALRAMQKPQEAQQQVVCALSTLPKLGPDQSFEVAFLLRAESKAALQQGDFISARAFLTAGLQCLEKSDKEERALHIDEFRLMQAQVAACQGNFEEATTMRASILARWTADLGESDPMVLELRKDMAFAAMEDGRFAVAESLLLLNHRVAEQMPLSLLAFSATELANFYRATGQYSKGLSVLNQACDTMPTDNVEDRIKLSSLAASLAAQSGKTDEAIAKYEWALSQLDQFDVTDAVGIKVDLLMNLSIVLSTKDLEKAKKSLEDADLLIDQLSPAAHDAMLHNIKIARQLLIVEPSDTEQAADVALLEEQMNEFDSRYGQSRNFTRAQRLRQLAREFLSIGESEKGVERLNEARELLESINARSSRDYGYVLVMLADAMPDWDPEAKRLRKRGSQILRDYRKMNE